MADLKVSLLLQAVDRASPQVKHLATALAGLNDSAVGRGLKSINVGINRLAESADVAAVAIGGVGDDGGLSRESAKRPQMGRTVRG